MEEEERRTLLLRERKRKEKKETENEAHETRDDDFSNASFSGVKCALNAEINGKFLLLEDDDDDDNEKRNAGGDTIKPDASRIVALDDLWRRDEDNNNKEDEKEDEEAKKVFVKSLASVNVTSEEEGTTRVVDVRASAEKYWERETVDRSGGEGEGSDDEKTLGAKNFIVEAASRNGGVVGEKFLFERLERVFPQTVFARAPVESFVFEGDDDDCEEEEEERKQQQKQNRYKYDAIVYNASDETSKFRYHIDGDPMTLLHPKSAFAEAYGGNYANRAPMGYAKNKNEKARIKPRFISLLVYLNDEWDPEWGGETKFLDEDSQIGLLVAAKPGRVVLFDSDVKHSACATTMPPRDDESNNKNKKRFSLVMKLIALPKKVLLNEEKNEDDDDKEEEEEEEEEVDLLRVNPNLGFGAATPIGSAKRLRDVVEAFSRKSSIK